MIELDMFIGNLFEEVNLLFLAWPIWAFSVHGNPNFAFFHAHWDGAQ